MKKKKTKAKEGWIQDSQFGMELVNALLQEDKTRYAIAQETGIPESTLSRFVSGQAGMTLRTFCHLADTLGWHLASKKKTKKGKK